MILIESLSLGSINLKHIDIIEICSEILMLTMLFIVAIGIAFTI